jgi:uncharacterized repeat protein (TIGR03833 family)
MVLNCPICPFFDTNESSLTRHIESAHFSEETAPPPPPTRNPPTITSGTNTRSRRMPKRNLLLLDHDIYTPPPQPVQGHDFPRLRDGRPPRQEYNTPSQSRQRSNIKPGVKVQIVLKADQPTGRLTEGIVKELLTSSANHPRGIKVRLQDGQVGRVQNILGS